jgi:alcohol dehydrogenase class IV
LFADLAIIDPRLSLSCDKRCLQDSSFDALSHAVETCISRASTETTKKFSIFAIKAILDLEPKIKKGKLSAKEQEKLSFAGSLMGINLALSSTCLPHRISYALPRETQFGMTHARAVALFFRPWLRRLSENFPGAIQELDKDLGFSSIDAVGGFMKNIGLYISPERKIVNKDRNFSEYICGRLRGNLRNDPSYRSKKDIIDILNNS